MQERVAVIEASGGDGRIGGSGSGGRGGRDYIPLKNQMPDTFDNELKVWRNWRTDLLSYVDTVTPGMKRFMIEVESMNASPSREWLQEFAKREGMPFVVEDQVKIWRVLKKTTKGEARKIVESIRDEAGYMAWREIVNNFEPAMASRQGTSLAELMAMVSLKASSPEETKMMLNELERRRKEAEDFSEAKIPDATLKGVLISFMDQRTNDHSTDKHSQGIPYVDLKNHVLKFINNTKTSSTSRGVAPMQLGIIKEGEQTQDQAPEGFGTENYPQYYPEGGGDDGYLWALKGGKGKGTDTRTCWLCNETGHIGRNCPSKGKGKGAGGKAPYQPVASKGAGKGYGQAKGQSGGYKGGGKGGGPKGGCWKCKGPHYADQCPMNQGNGQMRALGEVEGPTCQRLTVLCEVEKVADQKIVTTRLTKDKDRTEEENQIRQEFEEAGWRVRDRKGRDRPCRADVRTRFLTQTCGHGCGQECGEAGEGTARLLQPYVDEGDEGDLGTSPIAEGIAVPSPPMPARGHMTMKERRIRREDRQKEMIRLKEEAERIDPDEDGGPGPLEESDDETEDDDKYGRRVTEVEREDMRDMGICWAFGAEHDKTDRRRGRWRMWTSNTGESVKVLQTIEPEGVNAIGRTDGWEEITLYVDSGATETVIGEDMLMSVKITEGSASRRGVTYEIANGIRIPNLGEKRFKGSIEDGAEKEITAQVCSVNKALLSVSKAVKAGNRVVFDEEGSYIEDKRTGQVTWLVEEGGMYALKMWVKDSF